MPAFGAIKKLGAKAATETASSLSRGIGRVISRTGNTMRRFPRATGAAVVGGAGAGYLAHEGKKYEKENSPE